MSEVTTPLLYTAMKVHISFISNAGIVLKEVSKCWDAAELCSYLWMGGSLVTVNESTWRRTVGGYLEPTWPAPCYVGPVRCVFSSLARASLGSQLPATVEWSLSGRPAEHTNRSIPLVKDHSVQAGSH